MTVHIKRASLLVLTASVALFACGKKDDGAGGKPGETAAKGAAAKAEAKKAPAAPAAKPDLKAPAGVVAYGGTNSLKDALGTAAGLAGKVMPGALPPAAELEKQAGMALAGEMKLTDPGVVDVSKAIRFAILDPKKYARDPAVLLLPIKGGKDALVKALPETERKENDQGNAWSFARFQGSTRPVFVNLVGDHAVFTRDAGAFGANKAFIEELAKAKMPDLGAVYVEVDHLMALFGNEFDAGLAQAKAMMTQMGAAAPGGAAQMETVGKMVDWFGKAAKDVDYIRITAIAGADGAKVDVRVGAKANSQLAKTFGAFQGSGAHTLLAQMPADAPFFVSMAAEMGAMNELMAAVTEAFVISPIFKGDAAKAKPYVDAMKAYAGAMDGQMVMAAHGSDGLDLTAAFGVKDGKAARGAQRTLSGMHKDPATAEYYKALGLSVEYQQDAYKVGDVPVDVVKTQMANMPPEAAQFAALMGDFMTQHVGIGDKVGGMGYGAAGKANLEALLGGKTSGLDKAPGVARALKNAAANPVMVMYVSPIEVARRLKLGGMNTFAAQLQGIEAGPGLAISLGQAGGELQVVVDVPVDLVKAGMAAFQKLKGGF